MKSFRKKTAEITCITKKGQALFYETASLYVRKSFLVMQGLQNLNKDRKNIKPKYPTLILTAEFDIELAKNLAIDNSEYFMIKDAGHCANIDKLMNYPVCLQRGSSFRTFASYRKLKPKEQSRIEKGNWKLNYKWSDLSENAGFDRALFIDIYSYLCSYAHTGRLSALQIMQSKTKKVQVELVEPLIGYALMILSKFIIDYVYLIPETKAAFEANQDGNFIATIWKGVAENLKK